VNARLQHVTWWARQGLLTGGAVLGVVCLLLTIGSALFGLRPLVFQSGSMSPTIKTGALAISHRVDAASLEKGQVVSVPTGTGSRVTHRIVEVTHEGDAAILRLRGDANEATDVHAYRVTHADRVLLDVPYVGYAVGWLSGPVGLFLLGLYAAFLLSVMVKGTSEQPRPASAPDSDAPKRKRRLLTTGLAILVVTGAGAGAVATRTVTPTLAAWTDPADVTGTSLTAYTVPAPAGGNCAVAPGGLATSRGVDLTWPAPSATPVLGHTVSVTGLAGASWSIATVGANKVLTVSYNPDDPLNASRAVTVTAGAYLSGTPSWRSPTTQWVFKTGKNKTTAPACGPAVPPTLTITAPNATNETSAQKVSAVTASCLSSKTVVCGTVSASTTVSYILQRGSLCWNGATAYGSDCSTYQATDSAASWSDRETGNVAPIAYGTPGSYTLTVRAVDDWGAMTTQTVSFTLS
jgi:signal peptidase I